MNASTSLASFLISQPPEIRRATLATRSATVPAGNATEFHYGMHELGQGGLLAVPALDATLLCLEGELWLTREGDQEDYILGAGATLHLRAADQAVLQALRPGRLCLIPA